MNISDDKDELMRTILAVLVKRMGGQVDITEAELAGVEDTSLIADPDHRKQKLTVHLIPDYVAVEEPEPIEPFIPPAWKFTQGTTTINTTGPYVSNSPVIVKNGDTVTFNITYEVT